MHCRSEGKLHTTSGSSTLQTKQLPTPILARWFKLYTHTPHTPFHCRQLPCRGCIHTSSHTLAAALVTPQFQTQFQALLAVPQLVITSNHTCQIQRSMTSVSIDTHVPTRHPDAGAALHCVIQNQQTAQSTAAHASGHRQNSSSFARSPASSCCIFSAQRAAPMPSCRYRIICTMPCRSCSSAMYRQLVTAPEDGQKQQQS